MSIIITISLSAAEGRSAELKAKFIEILPDTRAFDGCERVELVEDPNTPGELMLIERWESAERYEAYKQWRKDSGTSVLAGDLVDGQPSVSTFTPVD